MKVIKEKLRSFQNTNNQSQGPASVGAVEQGLIFEIIKSKANLEDV